MRNTVTTVIIVLVLAVGFVTPGVFCKYAQAQPINGAVTFAGSVQLDTSSAGTATMVTAWGGLGAGNTPQVESDDGSFASFVTPGDSTLFHAPWSFNSGPVTNFWSVDGFVFNLVVSSIVSQSSNSVDVSGTGIVSGNGFTATSGTWNFTTQNPSASSEFSFSAATGTVPDGGGTAALFAVAGTCLLAGRFFLRTKATIA